LISTKRSNTNSFTSFTEEINRAVVKASSIVAAFAMVVFKDSKQDNIIDTQFSTSCFVPLLMLLGFAATNDFPTPDNTDPFSLAIHFFSTYFCLINASFLDLITQCEFQTQCTFE
jgi:hypothetical protein